MNDFDGAAMAIAYAWMAVVLVRHWLRRREQQ
jgi:hypothetical protein